jgi:zinc/manganese transport system substrate-binding protein
MILKSMRTILNHPRVRARALLGGILVLLAGCGTADVDDGSGLEVIATTSIWGDVVTQMVGEDANVSVLIPSGTDAHEYEPTSRQVAAIHQADLVVANGLGLEAGLGDVLEAAAIEGANILEVAPALDPIPFAGQEGEDDPGLDPHVWFDPERVSEAAHLIAGSLDEIDGTIDWAARADEYAAKLTETDQRIFELMDGVAAEDRKLVTNHQALGYFVDRYDFDQVGFVIPGGSSLGEPSTADLADLVDRIRATGARAIFAETTQSTRLAEMVAAEVGNEVRVVSLHTESLGEPGSGAETLVTMLRTNAELIAEALSGKG